MQSVGNSEVLRLLAKRNADIGRQRSRVASRLHSLLVELVPGGISKEINVSKAVGLRRGELAALRWTDVDLREATVSVRQSTTVVEGKPITGDVKTKRSRRVVDIDAGTTATLKSWARIQKEYALLHGVGWSGSGLVFTMPAGDAWHPDSISQAFERLVSPASKAGADALLKVA